MKKLSWGFNVVLAIAVVILFIFHFSQQHRIKELSSSALPQERADSVKPSFRAAYVFVDSLLAHYGLYQELTDGLVKKKANLEKELAKKGKNLDKEISDYQYKVQKHLITSWDAADQEKKLQEKQQVLVNLQNDMQSRLMDEQQKVNLQIHDSVVNAVNRFNQTHGYHVIFSHTFGGGLLFAEDDMNITREVLDMLNESYQQGKKK
ncbi:MAG: OmpH family outer membrane protein [Bacteroidales bacterium]|nr:OmpH family outer membrane protein [Bacteroidales bacterium]